jgi:sterol desaturase/sphingolipid hydroxylase (fatty acid hydroxylase superfamily)
MRNTNLILVGTIVALIVLERFPAIRRLPLRVLRPFFAADLALLGFGFLSSAFVTGYITAGGQWLGRLGLPRLTSTALPLGATTLIALVLLDLGNYIAHSTLHRFDTLWEFHKVHHSSRTLDWLATFRFHVVEQILRRLVAPALLIVVGVPLDAVAIAGAALQAWGVLNHSNLALDLRFLEPLLVTPRLHHLHHVPSSSGHNFGTVFSVWDRLLGRLETTEVPAGAKLGPPGEASSYPEGFVNQMVEPFRRLRRRLTSNASTAAGRSRGAWST